MNYKILFTVFCVLGASVLWAEYNEYERPPIVRYSASQHPQYKGDNVRIWKQQNVEHTAAGMKFNGKNAIFIYEYPWLYPERPLSATISVDVTFHEYKRGVVAGRNGYDNAIGMTADGRVFFNCFNRSGKKSVELQSKEKVKLNKPYRITGVIDCSRDNDTHFELYINCELVDTGKFAGGPLQYANFDERGINSRLFQLGGIQLRGDGTVRNPLACTVHEAVFYYKDLNRTEIFRLPGNIDKSSWFAANPVVEYGKDKAGAEFDAKGIKVQRFNARGMTPESFSITAKVVVPELPEKAGMIVGRPGFDAALCVEPDGRLSMTAWNTFTNELKIFSKTRVRPGEEFDVKVIVHSRNVETVVSLYVNGELEARNAITGALREYSNEIWFRGIHYKGEIRRALNCETKDCKVYGVALTQQK
jgi:hypothetical protein